MIKKLIFAFFCFQILFINAQDKKSVNLQDIWIKYEFYSRPAGSYQWMKKDQFYSELSGGKSPVLLKRSVLDEKKVDTLMSTSFFKDPNSNETIKVEDYRFSKDEKKVLIITESEGIYRHSSKEKCYVFDLESKKMTLLFDGKAISLADFSPAADKIAFTFENNLYYTDLKTAETVQITKDGSWGKIINGGTDWVYEEEFSFAKAFFWNADGSKLAYYKMDETHVKEFSMDMYGTLYPEQYKFKYPKAGEANAYVDIFVYDLPSKNNQKVDVGTEKDQYIPRIRWANDANTLAVMRLNRLQNKLEVLMANATSGATKVVLVETSKTYVEVTDYLLTFLDNGKEFIWMSERDQFNHIYLYDIKGTLVRQITSGSYDVNEIVGIDNKNQLIYFTSSEVSAMENHFYVIGLNGKNKNKLSKEAGSHSVEMSSNCNYIIDSYSSWDLPPTTVLADKDGKVLKTLVDGKVLKEKLDKYKLSKMEFFKFKTSENVELNGWMIKPQNFDEKKKYPVLMHCYGGPGHNTVVNKYNPFDFFWYQMLADKGYIIVSIDNRGTGGRGADFKKSTYKQLGKLEAMDQIEGAKYLGNLNYVDKTRIGIWGWSFGGYLTSLCLVKGGDVFKTGIAVAPVTNWRFYDSIYTERYLQRPQENEKGYDDNSPLNFADKLKGKYLLVHGTADDNVHFQNSMEWVDKLVQANVQFDSFFYPNKNHGIAGGITRFHLYTKMTDFLLKNL